MLSRRNVRIKVLQSLYAHTCYPEVPFREVDKSYHAAVNQSFSILVYSFSLIREVIKFVKYDADLKAQKLIQDENSLINTKFYDSEFAQSILNCASLEQLQKQYGVPRDFDKDQIRVLFKTFTEREIYQEYLDGDVDIINLLLELYRTIYKNETQNELIDDYFFSYEDDASLVKSSIKKIIKAGPIEEDFYKDYLPEDEKVEELGATLLYKTYNDNELLQDIIYPMLENWDPSRVTKIDMILLKMAVAEFLYFDSIPATATINEYIELSKTYSTPKSKEFINGILDKIVKSLTEQGKLNK